MSGRLGGATTATEANAEREGRFSPARRTGRASLVAGVASVVLAGLYWLVMLAYALGSEGAAATEVGMFGWAISPLLALFAIIDGLRNVEDDRATIGLVLGIVALFLFAFPALSMISFGGGA